MKIYENQQMQRKMVGAIRAKMSKPREGKWHMSEVFQCLRRTLLSRQFPPLYSEDAIMGFAVGFSLQEWMLGPEDDSVEAHGILYSPDHLEGDNDLFEMKSTRSSYEKQATNPETGKRDKNLPKVKFDPREHAHWMRRTRAYCALENRPKAHICVYHILQRKLVVWTIEWTPEELVEGLRDTLERKAVLDINKAAGTLPGFEWVLEPSWECSYCVHLGAECPGIPGAKKAEEE